jgi:hypothetical protein
VYFPQSSSAGGSASGVASPDQNSGNSGNSGLSGGAIGGIVGGVLGGLLILGIIAFLLWKRSPRPPPEPIQDPAPLVPAEEPKPTVEDTIAETQRQPLRYPDLDDGVETTEGRLGGRLRQ